MGSGGSPSQKTESIDTPLSDKQLEIINAREQQFLDFTLPRMKSFVDKSAKVDLAKDFQYLEYQESKTFDQSENAESGNLSRLLKQRGIESEGAQGRLSALTGKAKGKALNNTRLQAFLEGNQAAIQSHEIKGGALRSALGVAPGSSSDFSMNSVDTKSDNRDQGLNAVIGGLGALGGGLANHYGKKSISKNSPSGGGS